MNKDIKIRFFIRIYNWRVCGNDFGWWRHPYSLYAPLPRLFSMAIGWVPEIKIDIFKYVRRDDI